MACYEMSVRAFGGGAAAPRAKRWVAKGVDERVVERTSEMPRASGEPGRRIMFRGASILSLSAIGDFEKGDVIVQGDRIVEVDAELEADAVSVVEAPGMIVMPSFLGFDASELDDALHSALSYTMARHEGLPPQSTLFDLLRVATADDPRLGLLSPGQPANLMMIENIGLSPVAVVVERAKVSMAMAGGQFRIWDGVPVDPSDL
jgi:hypothetical protein